MNTYRFCLFSALFAVLFATTATWAQPPGRGGFGRGGDDDDRGRFGRGGDDGDRGRFGRGGDDGDRSRFGRGGPPGGFGGGPPGGSSRGGSSRGGFDPSSFLSRLDRNGNGVIDPDEQEGPASFMISRMRDRDPSIRPGQPIPLDKLVEGFNEMRRDRESGRGDDDNDRGRSRGSSDEAYIPELLVPGFGIDMQPIPLPGFGPSAEMLMVVPTEEDRREASEWMRRFDRDRDQMLSGSELTRFSGNPMDFDRNKDGKLSVDELAVRRARRRETEGDDDRRRRDDGRRGREEEVTEVPDLFNGRRSYRPTGSRRLPEGVPSNFTDRDADSDGQVTMAEFTDKWTDDLVKEFYESDFNRDGVITADEAIRRVEEGSASELMASVSAPAGGSSTAAVPAAPPAGSVKASDRTVKIVSRIVERYDKNNDRVLTPSEWEPMLMSPAKADADGDGRITIDEYASWMESKGRR